MWRQASGAVGLSFVYLGLMYIFSSALPLLWQTIIWRAFVLSGVAAIIAFILCAFRTARRKPDETS